jgi:hypothetical protein
MTATIPSWQKDGWLPGDTPKLCLCPRCGKQMSISMWARAAHANACRGELPETCTACDGEGWVDSFTACPECKGTGNALADVPPAEYVPPRPKTRRQKGLLALMVSSYERRVYRRAAELNGKGVTIWARYVLLTAAERGANPRRPQPTAPLSPGNDAIGRPIVPDDRRRDLQLRVGLTEGERARIDAVAKANGRRTSAWARAVLYAVVGLK